MAEREERAVTAFGQPFTAAFPQLADAQAEWEEEGPRSPAAPQRSVAASG